MKIFPENIGRRLQKLGLVIFGLILPLSFFGGMYVENERNMLTDVRDHSTYTEFDGAKHQQPTNYLFEKIVDEIEQLKHVCMEHIEKSEQYDPSYEVKFVDMVKVEANGFILQKVVYDLRDTMIATSTAARRAFRVDCLFGALGDLPGVHWHAAE